MLELDFEKCPICMRWNSSTVVYGQMQKQKVISPLRSSYFVWSSPQAEELSTLHLDTYRKEGWNPGRIKMNGTDISLHEIGP